MWVDWAGGDVCTCVCERGSVLEGPRKEVLGKGTREGMMRSLSDAGGNVQGRGGNMLQMCQRALTQKRTLGRWFECPSSLLERLQGRIALEALGERRGALVSDAVVRETATERRSEDGERAGVSAGADTKVNAWPSV